MILEDEEVRLSQRVRALLADMRAEWCELDRRIAAFDDEFAALAKTDDTARRLVSIPGIEVSMGPGRPCPHCRRAGHRSADGCKA